MQKPKLLPEINYVNYNNNLLFLNKYKLPDIKKACKMHKLKVTSNKPILIMRLYDYFMKFKYTIIIQKYFRRHIVTTFIKLKGPALYTRNLSVNNTDCVTLDNINDIPIEYFFSFYENNMVYSFNIISLLTSFKYNTKKMNPYTRSFIPTQIVFKIYKSFLLSSIIFNNINSDLTNRVIPNIKLITNNNINNTSLLNYNPTIRTINNLNNISINRYNTIVELRNYSFSRRVHNLFIEIDHLDNYSNHTWFSELSYRQYRILYRITYDLWDYRLNLTNNIKNQICPFHSPFQNVFNNRIYPYDVSIQDLKYGCLIVFENLLYSGITNEFKKLGALYILTALTTVSEQARASYPYLFESLQYGINELP